MANPKIFFVRKGNGGAQAAPSPQITAKGDDLTFENFTECAAQVKFSQAVVSPSSFSVKAGSAYTVKVTGAKGHYEYHVDLDCGERKQSVWGGSDPDIIIDP